MGSDVGVKVESGYNVEVVLEFVGGVFSISFVTYAKGEVGAIIYDRLNWGVDIVIGAVALVDSYGE